MSAFRTSAPLLLLALCALACAGSKPSPAGAPHPRVAIATDLGTIVIEIRDDSAPLTARNFFRYVDEKRFEGASFYRTVTPANQPNNEFKIAVIQGGLWEAKSERGLSPIWHETTKASGLRHEDGTLSMARAEPGTASSEFFICIGDQPELDFGGRRNPDRQGFAAFGRVGGGDGRRPRDSRPPREGADARPARADSIGHEGPVARPTPRAAPPSEPTSGLSRRALQEPFAALGAQQKEGAPLSKSPLNGIPGSVLLSHKVTQAVPSALEGLTAVFGMGTGVSPPL